MKLMTKNKARKLLKEYGVGSKSFENMLKAGQIKCLPCGDSIRIPEWSIELWLKNTIDYPTNSLSEVKSTISRFQPSSMDNEYSFVKARIQRTESRQHRIRTDPCTTA